MSQALHDRQILVRVKVEWAKEHLRHLEREFVSLGNQTVNMPLADEDADAGKISVYQPSIPLYSLAVPAIAGDAIHCLRSALDHLAYQLAFVGTGKAPSRQVEFPIAKDRDTYEREKGAKVKGIRPAAVKAIDALEPYKGGHDSLWRIHELDNIDKHRSLFILERDAFFTASWLKEPILIRLRYKDAPHFPRLAASDVENDVNLEIKKAAGEAQVSQADGLLPALFGFVDVVENIIRDFGCYLE